MSVTSLGRSDSSMDDCNLPPGFLPPVQGFVQIPLWTIVTHSFPFKSASTIAVQIPLWTIVTRAPKTPAVIAFFGSDSSMDDCNPPGLPRQRDIHRCSDSSMDDCNPAEVARLKNEIKFRFLYGRL